VCVVWCGGAGCVCECSKEGVVRGREWWQVQYVAGGVVQVCVCVV